MSQLDTAPFPPAQPPPSPSPSPTYPYGFYPPATPAPRKRQGRRAAELATVAVLAASLASGGTYAVTRATAPATASSSNSATTVRTIAPVVQADPAAPDWAATAKAVTPSVVSVSVASAQAEGEGSGVVIDTAGHILTNNHVATGAGPGAKLSVTLSDGRTYQATIAGTDAATDLAVLNLQSPPTDLVPIAVGDSAALAVGQQVMAVGNPLGLAGTVTTGIVSALDRPVSTGSSDSGSRAGGDPVVVNAIQTSAAINPGNSGGALVTASGQLIGINSSIASLGTSNGQSGNIGIGFAIPINEAKGIADQLIRKGSADHAYLGVSSADGTVPDGSSTRTAAILRTVAANTPAAAAGLRSGDAVIALGGKRIDSSLALVAAIRAHQIGDVVTATIVRDGQRSDISVSLTARPH
ncbi:MAG: trypsin-like peptidase domain-containing protein [Dermatophilaceae bacterium]|nr:trypsin-like peptidase domain-containing protein [Dermatophilaceae bacterium]